MNLTVKPLISILQCCDRQLIFIVSELKRLQIEPPPNWEVKTLTGLGLFDSLEAA